MKITSSNFDEVIQTYRIKTKEEFEDEFGSYWRHDVEASFIPDMDYLLGKPLKEFSNIELRRSVGGFTIDSWWISPDMLIEIDEVKTYNKHIADNTDKCMFKIVI